MRKSGNQDQFDPCPFTPSDFQGWKEFSATLYPQLLLMWNKNFSWIIANALLWILTPLPRLLLRNNVNFSLGSVRWFFSSFFSVLRTPSRVMAFVRVKPTAHFAQDMIRLGADNKVEPKKLKWERFGVCLQLFQWKTRIFASLEAVDDVLGVLVGVFLLGCGFVTASVRMENTIPVVQSPGKLSKGLGLADPWGFPSANHKLAQSISILSYANSSLCLLLLNYFPWGTKSLKVNQMSLTTFLLIFIIFVTRNVESITRYF